MRIVLVTLDTLRQDSLAAAAPGAMPRLTGWAAQGLVFEQFYASCSTTQPTHASLFTGLPPWEHGVPRNGAVLSEQAFTLAERLQAAGFTTAAVVASFPLHSQFGFAQGFDEYVDTFSQSAEGKPVWNERDVEGGRFFSPADVVTDAALARLDEADGERQFFWFHYFDPHAPYGDADPAGETVRLNDLRSTAADGPERMPALLARARELYDRDVAFLDEQLERLLLRLEADAPRWETHVLLTSDHGESFGEDGSFGHGKRVTRPQVHVPCVLLSPAVDAGTSRETAGSMDVLPTLLSLAGVPGGDAGRGRDLTAPAGTRPTAMGMRQTYPGGFLDRRTDGRQVRIEGQRFFVVQDGVLYAGDETSVEAEQDDPDPDLVADLRRGFAAFARRLAGSQVDLADDKATRRALEALGYVSVGEGAGDPP